MADKFITGYDGKDKRIKRLLPGANDQNVR